MIAKCVFLFPMGVTLSKGQVEVEMEGEPDARSSLSWEDILSSARVVLSESDKLLLKMSSSVREIVCIHVCVCVCVYGAIM